MLTHKTWTPPLSTFNTLTIIENRLKMRKLQPPQGKGGHELKKNKPSNITTKAGFWTGNFIF
jgi:hypothetical protein